MASTAEIADRRISKPFLGGYRDKITRTEYLNASSQTGPRRVDWENARTRETQCVEIAEAETQCVRDRAAQTWRQDLYIANSSDVLETVKSYESHDTMEKRLNLDGHARTIQKAYRAYRLLKYVKECSRHYRDKLEECKKLENETAEALRKCHEVEIIRQTFPRSRGDFDKLYNLIERWRSSRLGFANECLFSGSRKAENVRVLEKTTEMLKSLEKHRRCAQLEERDKRRIRFLTKHCKPIRWQGYKGTRIEMITLRVQKAREYKSIYASLMKNDQCAEDRIELLILLKSSLKNHSCIPVEDFIGLVDQEIVLLSNGVKTKWLNNLRHRMSVAYLSIAHEAGHCTCIVDTEEPSNLNFSEDVAPSLRTRKLLCKSCLKMLPYKSFAAHVRMKKLSCCLSCSWLRQQNIEKSDYGPYAFLLDGMRADEERHGCYSSLLYVIREPGIYHLVNNIWHGHSIVSENDDIFNLRLARFNVEEEWSPWNCILLTTAEAETHYYVKSLRHFYSKRLRQKICLAHQIAKAHFKELIHYEKKFRPADLPSQKMVSDMEDHPPSAARAQEESSGGTTPSRLDEFARR